MRFNLLVLFVLLSQYGWAQKSWKTFTSEIGAFAVDFPTAPQVSSLNRPTPDGLEVKVNLHMATISESAVAFVVYNDFPTGINITNDSLYLRAIARESLAQMGLDTSNIVDMPFEGFPGKKLYAKIKGGIVEMRVIIRGNRPYLICAVFPKKRQDDVSRFINSFKFLPYKKATWTTYTFEEGFFSVDLPGIPKEEEENKDGRATVYSGRDATRGHNYSVTIDDYSKYAYYKSDSVILALRTQVYKYQYDSVVADRDILVDGKPAKELILLKGKNHVQLRLITFVRGLTGYTMSAYLPPSEINGEDANHFFTSFKYTGKSYPDLFGDKGDLLCQDIVSNDSVIWKPAAMAFRYYAFKEKDVKAIQALIKQPYSDDRKVKDSRKEAMFEALQKLRPENSASFIESIYPSLSINPSLELAALKVLATAGTKSSLAVLAKLLSKHKPIANSWRYNFIFSPYTIDSVHQKSFLLSTLNLLPVNEYKGGLYMLAEHLLANKTLSITELSSYRKVIRQDFYNETETYLRDSTNQNLHELVKILGYEQQEATEVALLNKLTNGPDDYLSIATVTTLFRIGKSPKDADLIRLASNITTRTNLFSNLQEYSLEQHFPKEYANQDSLAVSEFNDYLMEVYDYDYSYSDYNITIAYKTEINYKGEKKRFYVMRFGDPSEDMKYIGICGPYSTDKLQVSGDLTNSDFVKDTGKDYHICLENYLAGLKK